MALSIAEHSYSLYLNISTDCPKQRKKEIQGKPEDPQDFLFRSPVESGHSVSMQLSKAHGPSTLISVLAPGTLSENVYNFIKWIYKYPTELGTPSKQIMSCDVSGEKKKKPWINTFYSSKKLKTLINAVNKTYSYLPAWCTHLNPSTEEAEAIRSLWVEAYL